MTKLSSMARLWQPHVHLVTDPLSFLLFAHSRTPGSRQPSPSEEDLTKNHSPGMGMAVAINKPDNIVGLQSSNSMVSSLTGQMVPGMGLTNGMGPMSGLTNGGGPPGKMNV